MLHEALLVFGVDLVSGRISEQQLALVWCLCVRGTLQDPSLYEEACGAGPGSWLVPGNWLPGLQNRWRRRTCRNVEAGP